LTKPLLSNNWYRLRKLKPRLRGHVQIHRHEYRGEAWYVIEDRVGAKHQRFNFASWRVIHLMDGRRDMDALWDAVSADLNDDTPTQDDIIRLLGQLHGADLAQMDITPDVAELFERRGKQQRRKWMGRIANPVALKVPLFDPDALLDRLAKAWRPWLGARAVVLWLLLVVPALLLLPAHWRELSGNLNERLLAADNLLMLALLFPLTKIVHELAHGLACKRWGGEVHETGVMLLALYPVPYVDVSSASAFVGKWQRALVGAAGMLAELALAAVAFYAWLLLEPGVARAVAYNVAVLCSLTTLFFNANPLLRYDGYYILADLIEIPNLGTRANKYWQYLAERFVFGVRNAQAPLATPGERRWFTGYAPLSYVYRLFVSIAIALIVAQQFFVIGVLIGLWTVLQSVAWPIFKGLRTLFTGAQFADRVARVRGVLIGGLGLLALLLFVLPLPHHTHAEGVLWLPERSILRAQSPGFAHQLLAEPGELLRNGQPVLASVEPGLAARIDAQRARVEEVGVQHWAAWSRSPALAQQTEQELAREQAVLQRLETEAEGLTLRSGVAGALLLDKPEDLPGRWLKKGEVVGYVRSGDAPLVRLVVPQSEVDAVRLDTRAVQVRIAQGLAGPWPAQLTRGVPAAVRELPSAALGAKGGGAALSDPRDDTGRATLESVFEFELSLPPEVPHEYLGSRVYVRFEHGAEPVGHRIWRATRRAFLSQFHV
jgi:putative peptide zinc metalloprotease protein